MPDSLWEHISSKNANSNQECWWCTFSMAEGRTSQKHTVNSLPKWITSFMKLFTALRATIKASHSYQHTPTLTVLLFWCPILKVSPSPHTHYISPPPLKNSHQSKQTRHNLPTGFRGGGGGGGPCCPPPHGWLRAAPPHSPRCVWACRCVDTPR